MSAGGAGKLTWWAWPKTESHFLIWSVVDQCTAWGSGSKTHAGSLGTFLAHFYCQASPECIPGEHTVELSKRKHTETMLELMTQKNESYPVDKVTKEGRSKKLENKKICFDLNQKISCSFLQSCKNFSLINLLVQNWMKTSFLQI